MLRVKITGVEQILAKIDAIKVKPEPETISIVKNASEIVVDDLKANYIAGNHYNVKRKKGKHLVDTIDTFPRTRKGQDDPVYKHYVGPKFTRFKKGQKGEGQGGQQAVFLEFGTGPRPRSDKAKGGIKEGRGRMYGPKIPTVKPNRMPAFGIISQSTLYLTGKKEVFGSLGIVYAILRIGLIGCVV